MGPMPNLVIRDGVGPQRTPHGLRVGEEIAYRKSGGMFAEKRKRPLGRPSP